MNKKEVNSINSDNIKKCLNDIYALVPEQYNEDKSKDSTWSKPVISVCDLNSAY